jgi:hypothetical protein
MLQASVRAIPRVPPLSEQRGYIYVGSLLVAVLRGLNSMVVAAALKEHAFSGLVKDTTRDATRGRWRSATVARSRNSMQFSEIAGSALKLISAPMVL